MSSTEHPRTPGPRIRGLAMRLEHRAATLEPWQRHALFAALGAACAVLVLVVLVSGAFLAVYLSAPVPGPDDLGGFEPSVVADQQGDTVDTLQPAELRRDVALDDLPDHVVDAVRAAEDRRFYDHSGYSVPDIGRAAWANLTAGEVRQGASTITQQYVSLVLTQVGEGHLGKFREAAVAARVEDELDKHAILETYLNRVPFGRDAQGIEAAARSYFGVSATELEPEQAAVLAGLIAAPSAFDPEQNPQGAADRRDFVLAGMREMDTISRQEAEALIGSDLPELRSEPLRSFGPNDYFLRVIREQVPSLVDDPAVDVDEGLVVHTTLDQRAQALATEQLTAQLGDQPYSGAAVTIESDSGAVRALVGGRDAGQQQFNVAYSGDRQPGSAFKTFALVELVARGHDPDATRVHAPEEYDIEMNGGEGATVGNYSGRGHGEVDVREATVDSINTAYVQLGEELDPAQVASRAGQMGITSELPPYPSLVLGTGVVRPIEMAAAYATLAAEGTRHAPFLIERIENDDGEVLYEHDPEPEEVLDPNVARMVTDVLVDVIASGTGTAAGLARPVAGKTGTTNDYRDAWFVGYTPQHATAVWVGNLDNTPMGGEIAGGSLPARIWGAYMAELVEPFDVEQFGDPDTSGLTPLTGLEAPEDDGDGGDGDGERDGDGGGDADRGGGDGGGGGGDGDGGDGRGPDGDGPPGQGRD